MRLSENQIQELYAFTRTHYVEHYDLQTKLVDHMAMVSEPNSKKHFVYHLMML